MYITLEQPKMTDFTRTFYIVSQRSGIKLWESDPTRGNNMTL